MCFPMPCSSIDCPKGMATTTATIVRRRMFPKNVAKVQSHPGEYDTHFWTSPTALTGPVSCGRLGDGMVITKHPTIAETAMQVCARWHFFH